MKYLKKITKRLANKFIQGKLDRLNLQKYGLLTQISQTSNIQAPKTRGHKMIVAANEDKIEDIKFEERESSCGVSAEISMKFPYSEVQEIDKKIQFWSSLL